MSAHPISEGISPALSAATREQSGGHVGPPLPFLSYRCECFLLKTGIIIIHRNFIQLGGVAEFGLTRVLGSIRSQMFIATVRNQEIKAP